MNNKNLVSILTAAGIALSAGNAVAEEKEETEFDPMWNIPFIFRHDMGNNLATFSTGAEFSVHSLMNDSFIFGPSVGLNLSYGLKDYSTWGSYVGGALSLEFDVGHYWNLGSNGRVGLIGSPGYLYSDMSETDTDNNLRNHYFKLGTKVPLIFFEGKSSSKLNLVPSIGVNTNLITGDIGPEIGCGIGFILPPDY